MIACIALCEGAYVLALGRRNAENRLFFAMTLCLAEWLVCAAFGYSAADVETVTFWFRLSSFGFLFLHPFTVHFILKLSGRPTRRLLLGILYGLSFVFLPLALTKGIVFSGFEKHHGFWIGKTDYGSLSFYLLLLQIHCYYGFCYYLLLRWRKETVSLREKKQAEIILVALAATVLLYNLEPFVLPLISSYPNLVLSPNMGLVWATGILVAAVKYRLLSLTSSAMNGEIVGGLEESVVLLDTNLKVMALNAKAGEIFGLAEGNSFTALLERTAERTQAEQALRARPDRPEIRRTLRLHIETEERIVRLIDLRISRIRDRFGDFLGFLLTAREARRLDVIAGEYGITPRELLVIEYILSGISNREIAEQLEVSERTVKAHITSIYMKLHVENKIQLYTLLQDYAKNVSGVEERRKPGRPFVRASS